MARTIEFKNEKQKELYNKFLCFLEGCIPSYRMPANKYYSKINVSIRKYLLNKGIDIKHILEISDITEVENILNEIISKFVYSKEPDLKTKGLKHYLSFLKTLKKINEKDEKLDDIEFEVITEEYKEGSLLDCHGSKYERSRKARKECLEYYGYTCRVCGFDFEKQYGKIGREFIEVHHRTEVSSYGGTNHKVHPIEDLIPVCSNCHSMLHRTRPAMSIADLSSLVKNRKDSCE